MVKRARIAAAPAPRTVPSAPLDEVSEEYQPGASSSQATSAAPSTFKIVVGTYEKLLYGLEGRFETGKDSLGQPTLSLAPIFIFPAHVACVRAVAASPQGGKWLATGSTDEIIKVWDLRRRKEVGGLVQHQGKYSARYSRRAGLDRIHRLHNAPLVSLALSSAVCLRGRYTWTV